MTGLIEIFTDAIKYPFKDIKALVIFGVLFIFLELSNILTSFGIQLNSTVLFILGIIQFIASLLIFGYFLSILKGCIEGYDEFPELDFKNNFIDGIKYLITSIVYFIIPLILVGIVSLFTGLLSSTSELMTFVANHSNEFAAAQGNATQMMNIIPQDLASNFAGSFFITSFIALILFIIFALFLYIAYARLADTGSIGEALKINEVFADIKEIGFGRYIGWYVLLIIFIFILSIIIAIISWIPYLGGLISALICSPFILAFQAKALGTLYGER